MKEKMELAKDIYRLMQAYERYERYLNELQGKDKHLIIRNIKDYGEFEDTLMDEEIRLHTIDTVERLKHDISLKIKEKLQGSNNV